MDIDPSQQIRGGLDEINYIRCAGKTQGASAATASHDAGDTMRPIWPRIYHDLLSSGVGVPRFTPVAMLVFRSVKTDTSAGAAIAGG